MNRAARMATAAVVAVLLLPLPALWAYEVYHWSLILRAGYISEDRLFLLTAELYDLVAIVSALVVATAAALAFIFFTGRTLVLAGEKSMQQPERE